MPPFNQATSVPWRAMVNAVAASAAFRALLAHQGGWDEILLVVGADRVVVGCCWRWPAAGSTGPMPTGARTASPPTTPTSRRSGQTRSMSAPTAAQAADEVVVAAVDVGDAADHGLALGGQAGDDHRRAGADVVGPHRRARQAGHAAHDGVVAVGADVGAEADQLLDVAEAARVEVLGDDADAVGDAAAS